MLDRVEPAPFQVTLAVENQRVARRPGPGGGEPRAYSRRIARPVFLLFSDFHVSPIVRKGGRIDELARIITAEDQTPRKRSCNAGAAASSADEPDHATRPFSSM